MKTKWKHGQKAKLAVKAGISKQYLNNILKGQKCPRATARKLEAACTLMNLQINSTDFLNSDITVSPYFNNSTEKRAI